MNGTCDGDNMYTVHPNYPFMVWGEVPWKWEKKFPTIDSKLKNAFP